MPVSFDERVAAQFLDRGGAVFNVQHPDFGAVGGGGVDDTAAIQAAADAAASAGGVLYGVGTFAVNGTIRIASDAQLSAASFLEMTPQAVLVEIGNADDSILWRKKIELPRVVSSKATGGGWAGMGIGVRATNLVGCRVSSPLVQGFATGLQLAADTTACAYNDLYISQFLNNRTGLHIYPGAVNGGYVNENNFWGGRFNILSAEGTAIAGARYIYLEESNNNRPNNNRFWGCSLEGQQPEYSIVCEGPNNYWHLCRWEDAANPLFDGAGAIDNEIISGYDAWRLISDDKVSQTNGAIRNNVTSTRRTTLTGSDTNPPYKYRNNASSNYPVIGTYASDPNTNPSAWVAALTGRGLEAKTAGQAHSFFRTEGSSRRVYFGLGSAAADTAYFSFSAAGLAFTGAPFGLPVFTDGTRPAAGTAGRVIMNTDDGNLNIDNGANWILPDGTVT